MSRIRDLLYCFVYNPTINNRFELAETYYYEKQYAIALTFYLKIAEISSDKDLQYYCLLRCANCFEIAGNRKHSVMMLYKHAINLLPNRPEAHYYLSRLYEHHSDWIDAYTCAQTACNATPKNDIYTNKLNYPTEYGPKFQKAIASWHIGRGEESRSLLIELKNTMFDRMDMAHKYSLQQNITKLGSSEPHVIYSRNNYNILKFKFSGADKIDRTYAQSMQDLFVLSILDGKQNGTYLEVGGGHPSNGNNTFLLETVFNWTGLAIEKDDKLVKSYNTTRKNKCLEQDALLADYSSILAEITSSEIIDYLQLDIEPATNTYEALTKIPFDKYKFRVVTYEHDYYADITQKCRQKSREYLEQLGYKLVINDICSDRNKRFSYEDWWVHPGLIDSNKLSNMTDNNLSTYKFVEEYFYK